MSLTPAIEPNIMMKTLKPNCMSYDYTGYWLPWNGNPDPHALNLPEKNYKTA